MRKHFLAFTVSLIFHFFVFGALFFYQKNQEMKGSTIVVNDDFGKSSQSKIQGSITVNLLPSHIKKMTNSKDQGADSRLLISPHDHQDFKKKARPTLVNETLAENEKDGSGKIGDSNKNIGGQKETIGGDASGGDSLFLFFEQPEYPKMARMREWEGTIKVNIFFDQDGNVSEVQFIEKSTYDILNNAVLKSVKKWKIKATSKIIMPKTFAFKLNP